MRAQLPTDMELSGEGSDVDMIHDDNAKPDDEDDIGVDPEEEGDDDDDEPEPEEVSFPCEWRTGMPTHSLAQDVESDELSPPPAPQKPRLKIKLKLPQILSPNESSSRAASTPSGEPSQAPSHRGISRGTKTKYFVSSVLRHDSWTFLQI